MSNQVESCTNMADPISIKDSVRSLKTMIKKIVETSFTSFGKSDVSPLPLGSCSQLIMAVQIQAG